MSLSTESVEGSHNSVHGHMFYLEMWQTNDLIAIIFPHALDAKYVEKNNIVELWFIYIIPCTKKDLK